MKYVSILLGLLLCSSAKADIITSTTPVSFTYDGDQLTLVLADEITQGVTTYYDANIGVEFFFYYDTQPTPAGWFVAGGYLVDPDPVIWLSTPTPGFYLEFPYPQTAPDPPADPPVTTPEPGVLVFLVSGLVIVWIAMTDRKPTPRKRYEAFCSNQFRK